MELNQNHNHEYFDFLDYLNILLNNRRLIFINVLMMVLLSLIITLIMPKTYTSTSVLMPPAISNNNIMSSFIEIPFGNILPKGSDESLKIIAILNSRKINEYVINKFDLLEYYNINDMDDCVEKIRDNTQIKIEDDETIRVSFNISTGWFHIDADEKRAKNLSIKIVQYLIEQLDVINKDLNNEKASFHRRFIENRYNDNIKDLAGAEDELKNFQETYKLISLSDQTLAAIEAASIIKSQVLANEVAIGVMSSSLNPKHPDIENVRKEIIELNKKMDEFEFGLSSDNSLNNSLFPPFAEVPELGVNLMRLMREVEIQNKLFIFLTQEYEKAKIEEARDTPTIQILDHPSYPNKKTYPKLLRIILITLFLSLLMNILYVFYNHERKILPN